MRRAGRALLCAGALACLFGGGAARGDGDAEPPYRAEIPDWWRDAPELVPEESELDGLELVSRAGFADPAGGCFAFIQVVDAPEGAKRSALDRAFRKGLTDAGIRVADASADAQDGEGGPLTLRFESGAIRGEVRLFAARREGGGLRAASVACFYNGREPTVSATLCHDMLDSFEVMP